jgi:hypothetical protein
MIIHRHEPTTGPLPGPPIVSTRSFSILKWCAWGPDRETRAAWRTWAGGAGPADDTVPPQALPMMMRRRLNPFGQRLVNMISACAEGIPSARYVLSTRHGELSRALSILKDIEAKTLPSPADFSMSIHHALLGLLSIHSDNRLGHTALSAGKDSFAAGLLEAAMCIAEQPDQPVIVVHADEPLPADYEAFREADDAGLPLVVALALGRPTGAPGEDISLQLVPHSTEEAPSTSMASDFLRFFLSAAPSAYAVGQRSDWIWRRAP